MSLAIYSVRARRKVLIFTWLHCLDHKSWCETEEDSRNDTWQPPEQNPQKTITSWLLRMPAMTGQPDHGNIICIQYNTIQYGWLWVVVLRLLECGVILAIWGHVDGMRSCWQHEVMLTTWGHVGNMRSCCQCYDSKHLLYDTFWLCQRDLHPLATHSTHTMTPQASLTLFFFPSEAYVLQSCIVSIGQ